MSTREKVCALAVLGTALPIGCAQQPEDVKRTDLAIAPTRDTDQLQAKSCDQSRTSPTESRPRISIYNDTGEQWRGFTFYYYVKADAGKTPELDPIELNGTDAGIEHVMDDIWRVRFACRGCTIGAGEIFPNPDGIDVRLFNAEGGAWNKTNDPSYVAEDCLGEPGWEDLPVNGDIPIFDDNYHRVGGNEVIAWPNDVEAPVVQNDFFSPLPASLQFQLPAPAGSWTASESVPDTLDLAFMAQESLNGMTQVVDYDETENEDLQFQLFFQTDWNHNPPVLNHEQESDDGLGKFLGPMVLSRLVSGTRQDTHIERHILNRYLRRYQDITSAGGTKARAYEGFIYHYFRDGNPVWKTLVLQAAQTMVEELVVPDGADYGYYPSDYPSDSWRSLDPWKDEILLMAYKQLGYARALDAVGKHIRWARYESSAFSDDGAIQNTHERGNPHFHIGALHWQPFLEYAQLVKDQDLIDWVKRSFEWAKSSESGSEASFGYFPELAHNQENAETCPMTDMIIMGMRLSLAGVGDYWDDVDTWVRNHFAESQLTASKAECMENWSRANYPEVMMDYVREDGLVRDFTNKSASRRSQGGFAGWPTHNSWKTHDDPGIQQCCTGNGSRAVSHVWENIATQTGSGSNVILKVNLALNRAAPGYEVMSYLPYQGKVRVKAKRAMKEVWLRIPGGFTSGITAKVVGGSSRSIQAWNGKFAKFGALSANQTLEVSFPNPTTIEEVEVADENLTVTKRGNTVISMEPAGDLCAMYHERTGMGTTTTPMVDKARWISSEASLLTRVDPTWKLPATFVESPDTNSGWVEDDGETIWVDFTGEKVLDGDQSHKSRWSATGDGKYTTYDLGRSYDLKYLSVASPEFVEGNQVVRDLEIQLSTNGTTWTTACHRTTSGIANSLEALLCTGSGRYVKIVGHGNDENMDNDLTEIEFWGSTTASLSTLSFPNPTASSSPSNTYKVKDNSLATYWTGGGTGAWIRMDLGALRSVATVELAIRNGTSRIQYFDIEVSGDDENWMLVYRGRNSRTTTNLESYNVPNVAARYVRIVGRGASTDDDLSISELRVKGY